MEDSENNLIQWPKCGSIQSRLGKWTVCSGMLGGSETIEEVDQAPSGITPGA